MICIPTIKSFVKSRMFNLINIQLLNILGSEITAKKCMNNDLILNWIPVYIKVTKIDSVRFDHTGIKSFFFKFQISVIFYNFIFFPPFLYFLFFFFCFFKFSLKFFFKFSDLFMETFVKPVSCLVFQPYIFPNIQKSLLILKQQIRIFPGLQFVWIFYAPFLIWIIFIKCTSSRSVKIY